MRAAIPGPASLDGDRNDYALEAARLHPGRFAVMGCVSLPAGGAPGSPARWKERQGMLGIRLTFHRDKVRPWLTDGTSDWF